jgi:mannose-1-phosphate guanylyltransferase
MPDSKPIIPVILSGGSGTRLWPMSRPERPKQIAGADRDETMLQLTAQRTAGERFAAPIVVANALPCRSWSRSSCTEVGRGRRRR